MNGSAFPSGHNIGGHNLETDTLLRSTTSTCQLSDPATGWSRCAFAL